MCYYLLYTYTEYFSSKTFNVPKDNSVIEFISKEVEIKINLNRPDIVLRHYFASLGKVLLCDYELAMFCFIIIAGLKVNNIGSSVIDRWWGYC